MRQVVNITDVGHLTSDADHGEDKMTAALKREGKPLSLEAMKEVGRFYSEQFEDDLKKLNIERPHEMPKASDYILEDIEIVSMLQEKGFAYKTSDGIYFDTSKYDGYGKLGGINIRGIKEGARVAKNPEKRNASDFSPAEER